MAKSNRLFFAVFNIIHEQNQNNKEKINTEANTVEKVQVEGVLL